MVASISAFSTMQSPGLDCGALMVKLPSGLMKKLVNWFQGCGVNWSAMPKPSRSLRLRKIDYYM